LASFGSFHLLRQSIVAFGKHFGESRSRVDLLKIIHLLLDFASDRFRVVPFVKPLDVIQDALQRIVCNPQDVESVGSNATATGQNGDRDASGSTNLVIVVAFKGVLDLAPKSSLMTVEAQSRA
jgi:hypothetical protein